MLTVFFWLSLLLAVADWIALAKKWRSVRWVTKPGMMVALIIWFTQVGHWTGPLAAIGLGLVFSLAGDIFLMMPKQFFLAGMGAFFLTHLFYIAGFSQLPLVLRWEAAVPALAVTGAFTLLSRRLRFGLQRTPETGLIIPVIAYAIILTLMWLAALTTLLRPGWLMLSAVMVSLGGGLFFLSDSVLAYARFVKLRKYSDLLVMVTYHLAQILIAGGVLEQFVIM